MSKFAEFTANQMRGYLSRALNLARKYAPNSHLRNAIVGRLDEKKGKTVIRITVIGEDARAYEYGSGVHSRRSVTSPHQLGPKGKILITPDPARILTGKTKGKALAFFWEKAKPELPRLEDGRVLLKQVKHPGVKAANNGKGYIAPAINETNRMVRERLRKDGRKALNLDIRRAFKHSK